MGGTLEQPPAAMIEISCRRSSIHHRSSILTCKYRRGRSVTTTRGAVSPRNAPPSRLEIFEGGEIFACFGPLPAGYWAVGKKTDSGPDFRLTRSRHPSASGRRIGSPPGDGWAARRDPETNRRVFYDAGLYDAL